MADFTRKKIENKTLGQVLKAARTKKEISLEQAEEETKIRSKYLSALEESRYEMLPGNVYALGFLEKYIDFLEIAHKADLILRFKTERGESQKSNKFLITRRLKESKFFITPKVLTIVAVSLIILGILGYIGYSVRVFMLPPNLQISEPSSEQIITENQVNIIGKTDEGSTLSINDQAVMIDGNGNFSQIVKLNPGLNTFEVKATNSLKKQTIKEVKVLAQF